MKKLIDWLLITVLLGTVFIGISFAAEEPEITVLNPLGTPPPIRLVPLAQRLDTLDSKTIYVINIGFGDTFLPEVRNVLAEIYPNANWIFKRKSGSYFDDDPKLWAEIKEKGDAMIMGVGH